MISGTITVDGKKFDWMEEGSGSSGGGNRAIYLNPGKHLYWFDPNPHSNPKYNKKQAEFYYAAASFIEAADDSPIAAP